MERTRTFARRRFPTGLLCLALAGAALLGSCATAPYMPSQRKVQKLVDLIDRGGVGSVKGLASAPFLLDGEILLRPADVDAAWANLAASGFKMASPKVVSTARVGDDSYRLFAGTMEVRAFFRNYLNKDSVVATIDSSEGRFYLLLNREVSGYPRIQGMRGPVR